MKNFHGHNTSSVKKQKKVNKESCHKETEKNSQKWKEFKRKKIRQDGH